jgi:Kef-type K+ transport system membrane component KefB
MREEALDLATRLMEFIPQAASALLIFLAFWIAGVVGKRLIVRVTAQVDSQRRQVLHLLAQITEGALVIVGLITALGTLGIDRWAEMILKEGKRWATRTNSISSARRWTN